MFLYLVNFKKLTIETNDIKSIKYLLLNAERPIHNNDIECCTCITNLDRENVKCQAGFSESPRKTQKQHIL